MDVTNKGSSTDIVGYTSTDPVTAPLASEPEQVTPAKHDGQCDSGSDDEDSDDDPEDEEERRDSTGDDSLVWQGGIPRGRVVSGVAGNQEGTKSGDKKDNNLKEKPVKSGWQCIIT